LELSSALTANIVVIQLSKECTAVPMMMEFEPKIDGKDVVTMDESRKKTEQNERSQ
jgi:hypothetical protein